jgi:hypothetical protein
MQDRYACDVGDFGKYGLLRKLTTDQLTLGVAWYLVPDETHNDDGRHIGYLCPEHSLHKQFKKCDPELLECLGRIVWENRRCVSAIEASEILGSSTVFHNAPLTFAGLRAIGPGAKKDRLDLRRRWLELVKEKLQPCNLIFLDPDNGLETRTTMSHHKKGPKYVFFADVKELKAADRSLVIYQHLGMDAPHEDQVRRIRTRLREEAGIDGPIHALKWSRGTVRVYFVVPCEQHRSHLLNAVQSLAQERCWLPHFKYIDDGMDLTDTVNSGAS